MTAPALDPSGLPVLVPDAPGVPSRVQVLALVDVGETVPRASRPAAQCPGQGVLA